MDPSRLVDDPRKVFIGGIPVSGDKGRMIITTGCVMMILYV